MYEVPAEYRHGDAAKDARVARVYNKTIEIARYAAPHLTQQQVLAIGARILKADPHGDLAHLDDSLPDGMVDSIKFRIGQWQKNEAALFRRVPTAKQVLDYELGLKEAAGVNVTEVERLVLWRELRALTPDELLARVPADAKLDGPDAKEPPQQDALIPDPADIRADGVTAADQLLMQRGINVDALDPERRIELRTLMTQQFAPKPMPHVDAMRVKLASGESLDSISPVMIMTAHREAAENGTTLQKLGLLK